MRYQLTQYGFPVRDRLIPVGTMISSESNDDFSKLALSAGSVPPINGMAFDQQTHDLMHQFYIYHRHLLQVGPGVQRQS